MLRKLITAAALAASVGAFITPVAASAHDGYYEGGYGGYYHHDDWRRREWEHRRWERLRWERERAWEQHRAWEARRAYGWNEGGYDRYR